MEKYEEKEEEKKHGEVSIEDICKKLSSAPSFPVVLFGHPICGFVHRAKISETDSTKK